MPRPRLGIELKKPSDYTYDFPHQRVIASDLTTEDIKLIASETKLSERTIYYWCDGVRRNLRIEKVAKALADINKKKLELIGQILQNN